MLKISAQRAAYLEMLGEGKFELTNRCIKFQANSGRCALWSFPSKALAEVSLRSWRRVFSQQQEAGAMSDDTFLFHKTANGRTS